MAMTDYLIAGVPSDAQSSNFTMEGMGNMAQPDIPGLSADEMKSVMDELVRKVLAPAFNAAMTEAYNNFMTLAPFLLTQRNVISDMSAQGVADTDIPNVEALRNYAISTGAGDMLKAVYDTDNDGVVDDAEHAAIADSATSATTATTAGNAAQLNGQDASYYATASNLTTTSNQVTSLTSRLNTLTDSNTNLKIRIVTSLPSSPDANTIYLVK